LHRLLSRCSNDVNTVVGPSWTNDGDSSGFVTMASGYVIISSSIIAFTSCCGYVMSGYVMQLTCDACGGVTNLLFSLLFVLLVFVLCCVVLLLSASHVSLSR
jgi:hypothetical protein